MPEEGNGESRRCIKAGMINMQYASIIDAIRTNAEHSPARLCLVDGTTQVTYGQYWQKICRAAENFQAQGLARDGKAMLISTQTIDYLAALHAVQLAGAIAVPLERGCVEKRIREIANALGTAYLYGGAAYSGIQALTSETGDGAGTFTYPLPKTDSTSLILFTTGTTGTSKGIELTHGADVAVAENVKYGVQMQPDNVEMLPMPLNHSFALRRYFASMINGSAVALTDGVMNLKDFYATMQTYHATSMALAPSMLSVLLKLSKAELAKYDAQLDFVQMGSAPLPEQEKQTLMAILPSCRLYNLYGSTEVGCACILDFNRHKDMPNCIGRPTVNSLLRIVDDHHKPIETNSERTGFLCWGGSMCMKGYYGDPDLTHQVLVDGFIRSNDVGYMDGLGWVYMLGRNDDVILSGGMKIQPADVEKVAIGFAGVSDSICFGRQISETMTIVALGYVSDTVLDPIAYRNFLSANLNDYMVPRVIEKIDSVPRTFNGKILRKGMK
jgi:long-chain acyl-CoA synthetase